MGVLSRHEKSVAVWLCTDDIFGSDESVSAGFVFDNDRLAERGR